MAYSRESPSHLPTTPAQLRRARAREHTRERFLEFAERAFRERAYESVTIERIAAAAGYSKRSIYLYFRDKRDLFEQVLARELLRWNEALREVESRESDPLRQIEAILIECFDYVDRDPVLLRHLHEAWSLAAGTDRGSPTDGEAELERGMTDLIRTVTRCLDRASVAGTLSGEADPNLEARWIWSQIVGALTTGPSGFQTFRSESFRVTRKEAAKRIVAALS
jgi:AcrR family transcriptional regulator